MSRALQLTIPKLAGAVSVLAGAATALLLALPTTAGAAVAPSSAGIVYVDGASLRGVCSDTRDRATASVPTRPVCTLARGAALAQAGDTVSLARATYRGPLAAVRSGIPGAPIRFAAAESGVVINAAGGKTGVKVAGLRDLAFSGFTVTGATGQGIWIDAAQRVSFAGLAVTGNTGPGVQVRNSAAVSVTGSRITANKGAGIQELGGVTGALYSTDVITGNGRDGNRYNGDGIQLDSTGTVVRASTISNNGDDATYEHGIYVDETATGFLIEGNVLDGNAASSVKAEGSGVVRYNRMGAAALGMFVDHSTGTGVEISYNVIKGSYRHALHVASGADARVWNNTLINTSTVTTGQPTAVFAAAANKLDLRNNVLSVRTGNARAISVPSATAVAGLTANANWYAGPATTLTVWNGQSATVATWKARSGQDAGSIASGAPVVAADGHVTSANLGRAVGAGLGLTRDLAATPVPARPDLGAYQAI
jgi:hypothetical protein